MTEPKDQWWTLNGAVLMSALERAKNGDSPSIVYLELIANSSQEGFSND